MFYFCVHEFTDEISQITSKYLDNISLGNKSLSRESISHLEKIPCKYFKSEKQQVKKKNYLKSNI